MTSFPKRPASKACRSLTTGTLNRFCLITKSFDPATSQAAIIRSASANVSAIGFSTMMCFLNRAKATTWSA